MRNPRSFHISTLKPIRNKVTFSLSKLHLQKIISNTMQGIALLLLLLLFFSKRNGAKCTKVKGEMVRVTYKLEVDQNLSQSNYPSISSRIWKFFSLLIILKSNTFSNLTNWWKHHKAKPIIESNHTNAHFLRTWGLLSLVQPTQIHCLRKPI